MKASKAWLQTYFSEPLPETDELVRLITFGIFEVEGIEQRGDDDVLDIKVLPDRSSYCLSHRGIAREIGVLLGRSLTRDPFLEPLPSFPETDEFIVSVENPALCPRYSASLIRGVKVGPSPEWLKKSLETLGQRSINNVVDATNYVMLNLGEPLHAFDAGKLTKKDGVYHIAVRGGKPEEKITTLTGETYTAGQEHLLIVDGVRDIPIGIAGIKGGKDAEITAGTTDIVLEAANFNSVSVRKTSRALKLITDASVRFQNAPSPRLVPYAMRDTIALIKEIAGGELAGTAECAAPLSESTPVAVSLGDINAVLGTRLSAEGAEAIWKRFGFAYVREGDRFTITPPFERSDITIKEDLIEEIGRVYGYEHIAAMLPPKPERRPEMDKRFYYGEKIRHTLTDLGFSEVYTYTLCEQGSIELENPLAADKAFLRAALEGGLRKALALNLYHAPLLGLDTVKLFELGTVFTEEGEHLSLALSVAPVRGKKSQADDLLRAALVKLGEVLGATLDAPVREGLCELDTDALIAALPQPAAYDPLGATAPPKPFVPFSSFPFVLRDIAVWMPEDVDARTLEETIRDKAGDLLARLDLFDTFSKDGRTSRAFHLVFQSCEKTLTDEEINMLMEKIVDVLNEKGGEVR